MLKVIKIIIQDVPAVLAEKKYEDKLNERH